MYIEYFSGVGLGVLLRGVSGQKIAGFAGFLYKRGIGYWEIDKN